MLFEHHATSIKPVYRTSNSVP